MSFVGDALKGLFGGSQAQAAAALPPPTPIAAPPPPPTVASVAGTGAGATAARAAAGAQGGTITNPQGSTASSVVGGKATLSGVA